MIQCNITDARNRLSELLEKALLGEEIIIAKENRPLVKIVPIRSLQAVPGVLKGQNWMAPDFDEPIPGFEKYIP